MSDNHKSKYVIQTVDLRKDLQMGQVVVQALRGVSITVNRGEFLSIIGPSGSGKSTLLGLIGGLDNPTSGEIFIDGVNITHMDERSLTRIRNEKIGFIFQFFNLIPTLTAQENVALPIQFSRKNRFNAMKRAAEILEMLGMADRMHHRPNQLSGGQQQRVAIARALANKPPILMCDEPTGNLDSTSGEIVMQALRDVQKNLGTTIVMVTHDMDLAAQAERVIALVDGHIASDVDPRSTAQMAAMKMLREKRATGESHPVSVEE